MCQGGGASNESQLDQHPQTTSTNSMITELTLEHGKISEHRLHYTLNKNLVEVRHTGIKGGSSLVNHLVD